MTRRQCSQMGVKVYIPRRASSDTGDGSRFIWGVASLRDLTESCCCSWAGERAPSENDSEGGVSISGENALVGSAPGGRDGKAFSTVVLDGLAEDAFEGRGPALAFFRRLAIRLS